MPVIYDNIDACLESGLNKTLEESWRSDFCIGYFNLRGWRRISKNIESLSGNDEFPACRLLIGMQRLIDDDVRSYYSGERTETIWQGEVNELKRKAAEQFRDQLVLGNPTNQDEAALRKLLVQLREKKVVVKLHLEHTLHAKLYLAYKDDFNSPIIGFVGSSNLTLSGISDQGELNVDVVEQDAARKLAAWFQDRWDNRWSLDISEELAQIIENSWASEKLMSPYHIYLKMAYHLSSEARAGITEFQLPKIFCDELLPFQQSAVKVAAHHLNRREGVLIGDVVGLGKTITATALAKMFENDFGLETLILCPKNLENMWKDYAHKYQLRAHVIPISKAQNKLPHERRYRLVIIDESHNLRNREGRRYAVIKEYISKNDCKVILVTATPYNKSYLDLSSQLKLFLNEDYNLGISPEKYIDSIGGSVQYNAKHQSSETSLAAFEHSPYSEDWSELMRLFLVRRTRSFVKKNYAKTDETNGRCYLEFNNGNRFYFPERLPKKVEYRFNPKDTTDQYARLYSKNVVDSINKLSLPRYGLGQDKYKGNKKEFIATKEELQIQENLGRAGSQLIGFARTNLFKRLESSGHSFILSISRHILRNYLFFYAIENEQPFPIGKQEAGIIDEYLYTDNDMEGDSLNSLCTNSSEYMQKAEEFYKKLHDTDRYDWIRSQLFSETLKKDLHQDCKRLMKIQELAHSWNSQEDRKLNALYDLITQKHGKEKILIFTQYSDTAKYLENTLKSQGVEQLESVDGSCEKPEAAACRFSPGTRIDSNLSTAQEIRVLIATDVLSEGQNLQDAHIVVNYDLPWAIIRLIQRAGRVDRIGQKNPRIYCYSFLPEDGIENIINLRSRLSRRISENAETVGSDEVFFEGDPINIADLYNEKSGILDEEDDLEVDLSSFAYQIWKDAIEENPSLEKKISELPRVVYATKSSAAQKSDSSIVYTKTAHENDIMAWVNKNGSIITCEQLQILKAVACEPDETPLERFEEHHELVKIGLEHIKGSEAKVGGQLGKKSGVRYKTYMRLKTFLGSEKDFLWASSNLKSTIQAIFDNPLTDYAKTAINRQMKANISDENLVSLVETLHEEGRLCLSINEKRKSKEPQIICSMGLRGS